MNYFLSRYNRFYSFIIHQKIAHLYAFTFSICSIICIVWFFGCYRLLNNYTIATQQKINNCSCVIQTIDMAQKKHIELTHNLQSLKKQLLDHKNNIAQNLCALTLISHAAQHVKISITHCTLQPMHKKKDIEHQQIQCSFSATLSQIIAFFDYLYAQKISIKCTELTMQAQGQFFDIQCTLTLYCVK